MIELYSWAIPEARAVHVMLEECGLAFRVHPVDMEAGAHFAPSFLAISPAAQLPALVDPQGPEGRPIALSQGSAILIYLAARSGRFLPVETRARYELLQWLLLLHGPHGVCTLPQGSQAPGHARASLRPQALPELLERRLAHSGYLGGAAYSIVDMAAYPWLQAAAPRLDWPDLPRLKAWLDELSQRPALQRGMALEVSRDPLRRPARR